MPQYGLRYYPREGGFLKEFDRSGYYGFANLDQQNSKTRSLQAIFSHQFSDAVKIRNLTRYEHIRQNTITSQPNGPFCLASTGLQPPDVNTGVAAACTTTVNGAAFTVPAGYYLPTGGRGVQRFINNTTAYNQIDLSADFDTGGVGHTLVIGASALWEQYRQEQGALPRNADGSTLWVTRSRPKIDRIACPWLIRRFVDPRAVFFFVTPAEVVAVAERFGATPFDIEGVPFSHRGDLCTFDVMLDEFGLITPALARLATIVRGADTARLDLAPEVPGLLAASLGLSRMYSDDLEQLEAGLLLYDAFYRWSRDATEETHNWPAPSAKPEK